MARWAAGVSVSVAGYLLQRCRATLQLVAVSFAGAAIVRHLCAGGRFSATIRCYVGSASGGRLRSHASGCMAQSFRSGPIAKALMTWTRYLTGPGTVTAAASRPNEEGERR